MQPKRSSTGELLIACLRWATIAVCFGSIALVFGVIALRLSYPYQLEWMEGAVLQHIHVVQSGRVPYSEPSILFSPFFYTPLFYYVSAAVMLLTGDGFLGPRLVSIGASVASAALVYALVRGEKGDKLAALCGCAFFAASYWPTGRWFDLARVDSLYVFFALAGAFAIRHGRHPAWPFAAGLLFCLACLTKQTAAVIALPLFAWCLAFRPRELLRLIGSFTVFSLAAFAWLQWSSDGWFGYCMFGLSSGHPLKARGVETFLLRDLALQIPIALTLIAAAVVVGRREWPRSASQGFLLALVAGGVIASFVIRIKVGAWTNNLMPAYAVLAVASASPSRVYAHFPKQSSDCPTSPSSWWACNSSSCCPSRRRGSGYPRLRTGRRVIASWNSSPAWRGTCWSRPPPTSPSASGKPGGRTS